MPPRDATQISFLAYATQWLEQRELGPRTRAEYQRMLDGRLAWFHRFNLDQINALAVKLSTPGQN